MLHRKPIDNSRGFTIVEFMVATLVFSVVIMGVSAAILHISRMYQRSINASSTQAVTRNLIDTVAQSIQFSSEDIELRTHTDGKTKAVCVGTKQFLYIPGRQLGGDGAGTSTENAVVARQNNDCTMTSILTATIADSSKELLSRNMRLVKLDINQNGSLYTVTARVAYGDDDLLCSPRSVPGSCENDLIGSMTTTELLNMFTSDDLTCRGQQGSQYCAVSELSTTVYRRL